MNKSSIQAVLMVLVVVLIVVVPFSWATATTEQPEAAQDPGCIVRVEGTLGIILCGGEQVGQLNLPTVSVKGPTITLPPITLGPITLPPETIRPPRATVTEETTIIPPKQTETIVVPGDTVTVKEPRKTKTVTETATSTVTLPPRQLPPSTDTIGPRTIMTTPPSAVETLTRIVGISLLAIFGLMALMLVGMYAGYIIGWKDQERRDTNFIRAVLEQSAVRKGKHS